MLARIERSLTVVSAGLDRACKYGAYAAMTIMLVSILIQIVARYVFASPPAWTDELARYAMIWAGLFGATMAYYRRADPVLFRLDTDGRPRRALTMQVIELGALVTFVAPVLYYAPGFLERHARRITETLEINSALVVVIVPLSLAILLVHQVARVASAAEAIRLVEVPVAVQSESAS